LERKRIGRLHGALAVAVVGVGDAPGGEQMVLGVIGVAGHGRYVYHISGRVVEACFARVYCGLRCGVASEEDRPRGGSSSVVEE
jgi:hypothetical protein